MQSCRLGCWAQSTRLTVRWPVGDSSVAYRWQSVADTVCDHYLLINARGGNPMTSGVHHLKWLFRYGVEVNVARCKRWGRFRSMRRFCNVSGGDFIAGRRFYSRRKVAGGRTSEGGGSIPWHRLLLFARVMSDCPSVTLAQCAQTAEGISYN